MEDRQLVAFSILSFSNQGGLENLFTLLETAYTAQKKKKKFYPSFFYLPYLLRTRK